MFVVGFFPLLLWETMMEEVITRQNDSCELTSFFGSGWYGKCAIVMKAGIGKHCFVMQTTVTLNHRLKRCWGKLSWILPCQQPVVRTKEHSRLFACTEAQQAEGKGGPLHSLLPSPARGLFCMLHFLVPWGLFTVVLLPWQMWLRPNLAYLVFGSRVRTASFQTYFSFWGNCNTFQSSWQMAALDCHPAAMALSQELKFPPAKCWICFRGCSLIEMAYTHGFLWAPPWVFSAFLSHLSKKMCVIGTFHWCNCICK